MDETPGEFYWNDGSEAEFTNFEPNYGLEFSGTGDVKISVDKMKKLWKLEKGSEERSFACQCPTPGQDNFDDIDFFNNGAGPQIDAQPVYDTKSCRSKIIRRLHF